TWTTAPFVSVNGPSSTFVLEVSTTPTLTPGTSVRVTAIEVPGASGSVTPAAGKPDTVPLASISGNSSISSLVARSTLPSMTASTLTRSPSVMVAGSEVAPSTCVEDVTKMGTNTAGVPSWIWMVTEEPGGSGRLKVPPGPIGGTSAKPAILNSE